MDKPPAPAQNKPDRAISSEDVTVSLSRAIHEHRLAPGTKLGEDELADIFGVSRTIIRTSLHALSHTQIVEIHRNRGAFVAQPSPQEAHEVFEARELLEPRTARSAALNATPQDVAVLKAHIHEEHAALAQSDQGGALYLSGQLHIHIARIAAQNTIAAFIETLIARSSLIVALYWKRKSALCESSAHTALVTAIADKNQDDAENLMITHLKDLRATLDLNQQPVQAESLRDILKK